MLSPAAIARASRSLFAIGLPFNFSPVVNEAAHCVRFFIIMRLASDPSGKPGPT